METEEQKIPFVTENIVWYILRAHFHQFDYKRYKPEAFTERHQNILSNATECVKGKEQAIRHIVSRNDISHDESYSEFLHLCEEVLREHDYVYSVMPKRFHPHNFDLFGRKIKKE